MSFLSDLRVLYHLAFSPIRGKTHAERLESFYQGQASDYDGFRKRLLHGREALYRSVPARPGDVWIDMGGGTGANLEHIGPRIASLKSVYVVDLSSSLLQVARERFEARGWTNVRAVEADVTRFVPEEGQADVITFSYSLTMIPDWFRAIDHALTLLRPGGRIGVVDFYVSRKYPPEGLRRHPWITREFWPVWFGMDNVHPSRDHVPYLLSRFERLRLHERRSPVPYLPGKAPNYTFIGRKPG